MNYQKYLLKNLNTVLKKCNLRNYLDEFCFTEPTRCTYKDIDLIVTSSIREHIYKRDNIVNTLKDINYKRGNKEWNESTAVAFIHEVFLLYKNETDPNNDELNKQISKRYNIEINRFKTQVALFINNWEKGKDKFHLEQYFSKYEFILWKYRDIEKLQKCIEEDKLNEQYIEILRQLDYIV